MSENNIASKKMSYKELINEFANNIINNCIDRCIQIENEKHINGFYLLKYNNKTQKYSSNLIDYSTVLPNFDEKKYFLIDILNNSTNHLNTILPIPVLNGQYLKKNICINNLENKLIIIFINMENIDSSSTFSYFMNALNSSNIDFNIFNTSNIDNNSTIQGINNNFTIQGDLTNQLHNIENTLQNLSLVLPPPPNNTGNINIANIPNNTTSVSLNNHRETYSEQIEQMKMMGFTNEYKIIESLIVSDGDVNSAINYYLQ